MKRTGFTILELLITTGVIMILSGALMLTWDKGEDVYALQRAVYKLERDIKEVQSRTMEADEVDCGGGFASASFGIYFDLSLANQYMLFVDCDSSHGWSSGDVLIETVRIEEGVELFSLSPNLNNKLNIVFDPPEPITYINSVESGLEGKIRLSLENDFNKARVLRVNNSGRVDIE